MPSNDNEAHTYCICPNCEGELEYLNIMERVEGWRYGTVDMYGDSYEYEAEETDDITDVVYACPSCLHEETRVEEFQMEMTEDEYQIFLYGNPPPPPPKPKPKILTFFNEGAVDDI